jgi:hypothetical protein
MGLKELSDNLEPGYTHPEQLLGRVITVDHWEGRESKLAEHYRVVKIGQVKSVKKNKLGFTQTSYICGRL